MAVRRGKKEHWVRYIRDSSLKIQMEYRAFAKNVSAVCVFVYREGVDLVEWRDVTG